jgi:phosphopantothenoylcysteine decarboxylase/phosphopantothenate--cysteine ligase
VKLIAFKAEHGLKELDLIKIARSRLLESGADMIVANDVSLPDRGFGADTNEVVVIFKNAGHKKIPFTTKTQIARLLVTFATKL